MPSINADTGQPVTEGTANVQSVALPTVILLRAPGYGERTWNELRAAFAKRGWYVTSDRQSGWHLQRGGAQVVLVDLHHANGLDSDPIQVGQVRAKFGQPQREGDEDYQPHELRLMTGGDYPRDDRWDADAINNMNQPGAYVLDVDKVVGYVDDALAQQWRRNAESQGTRG